MKLSFGHIFRASLSVAVAVFFGQGFAFASDLSSVGYQAISTSINSVETQVSDISAQPQDEECVDCIVSKVLDRLPAQDPAEFDELMAKLTTAREEGVYALAAMLAPAEEGENSLYEYALNGLVAYVSAPGREEIAAVIKNAIFDSIDGCEGLENQGFLINLARLLSGPEDAARFAEYLEDDYLKPFAVSALITIPDIDDFVLDLVRNSSEPDAGLAYLAAYKGIVGAEDYLLKWVPSDDPLLAESVYQALGACGSEKSIDVLAAAAQEDDYALGTTNACASYLNLVRRLVADGRIRGFDEAELLLKSDYTHVRVNALNILLHSDRVDAEALLLAALQDGDREYRCAALFEANDFAGESLYESFASLLPNLRDEARADIITWFGERGVSSQVSLVAKATASENPELALAAVKAAGRIGGDEALEALAACLDGPYADAAEAALASFKGDIRETVADLVENGPESVLAPALRLAGHRNVKQAASGALALTASADPQIRQAAFYALEGTCSEDDFDALCDLLDGCDEDYVPAVQDALISAGKDVDYARIASRMSASVASERYYPLLAGNGSAEAVETLRQVAKDGSDAAFVSLLNVEADTIGDLLELGARNPDWRDAAATRVCDLIQIYVSGEESAPYYMSALDLEPSAAVINKLLNALGDSHNSAGIAIALNYIDSDETSASAAYVIKAVAAGNPELLSDDAVRAALEKARDVYSALSVSDADAGYSVDEINGLLAR